MAKRMLIDATHPEETRVVVVSGTRLEELDVESSTKKQLKGNIYLAKIIRVEPSLQAAFVDYGGNRHGFLAFSEIHPDYYQIPVADRKALLAEQRRDTEAGAEAAPATAHADGEAASGEPGNTGEDTLEMVGGDDVEEVERRRPRNLRNYKIQEVIKRRQVVLVQVVKEERGNKGAALTTYLSLAGRYCVLMPNTARGGGVSRKITSAADRKRLKSITSDLDIPDGMAVIVRTAGSERSKAEIKRDYEYLLRLWDSVRDLTLQSTAPALVYEEANLIKRSIRDLYSRDIEEIEVEGEEGYRLAKDFMRMLTPSHAKRVQPYRDQTMPLFYRYQVESQLDAMHSPIVQLKSGGYIVISPTEALVSIDVNSGRSTKERHIEETALKTNLEASDEIARQLRLRDLAGLIVIDFIDMEENRNNHAVERRLKEAMRHDRARIQLGRISPFGLLELSRQRLRPSLMETSFQPCTHCGGTGTVRSVESAAVHLLRAIEEEGIRHRSSEVTVTAPTAVALYILNQKRTALAEIEGRYGFKVFINGDDTLIPPNFRMDRIKAEARPEEIARAPVEQVAVTREEPEEEEEEEQEAISDGEEKAAAEMRHNAEGGKEGQRKRRKRRKRRKPGSEEARPPAQPADADEATQTSAQFAEQESEAEVEAEEGEESQVLAAATTEDSAEARKSRRRGRRGGKRRRRPEEGAPSEAAEAGATAEAAEAGATAELAAAPVEPMPAAELLENEQETPPEAPPPAAIEATATAAEGVAAAMAAPLPEEAPSVELPAEAPAKKPARRRKKAESVAEAAPAATVTEPEEAKAKAKAKPRRRKKADTQTPSEEDTETAAPAVDMPETAISPAAAAERAAEPAATEAETVSEPSASDEEAVPEPALAAAEQQAAPAEDAAPTEPPQPPRRGWWRKPA